MALVGIWFLFVFVCLYFCIFNVGVVHVVYSSSDGKCMMHVVFV